MTYPLNDSDPFAKLRAQASDLNLPLPERKRAGLALVKAQLAVAERRRPAGGYGAALLQDPARQAQSLVSGVHPDQMAAARTMGGLGPADRAAADAHQAAQDQQRADILNRLKAIGDPERRPAPTGTPNVVKSNDPVIQGLLARIEKLEAQRRGETDRVAVVKALQAKASDPDASPASRRASGLELLRQSAIAAERARAGSRPGFPTQLLS